MITEKRKALRPVDDFEGNYGAEPPEATAAVVAWLATSADATSMVGKWIYRANSHGELGRDVVPARPRPVRTVCRPAAATAAPPADHAVLGAGRQEPVGDEDALR